MAQCDDGDRGVSDPNDFTVAFNSSNMSNARLDFTFPVMPELRMDMWEECEGRFVGPDEEQPTNRCRTNQRELHRRRVSKLRSSNQ